MDPVIDVENISFAYDGRPVLENVSVSIERGELLGIIGPNGGGKTTLLKIMLGLLSPDAGRVSLFGSPTNRFEDGQRIGYVAQHATETQRQIPITVREVVRMGRYPHVGLNGLTATDEQLVNEALEKTDIADLADSRVGNLSGGQKQRTYIARVLAGEADLLALDEPTVGIDADAQERFYDLIDELNRDNVTIVLVEHDLDAVLEYASSIACINRTLDYHGDATSFLESEALVETFGTAGRAIKALS